MEVALRECIATAMWKANINTGLRVSIVPLIQKVLMELFRKTDLFESEEAIVLPTTATMALSTSDSRAAAFFAPRAAAMTTPDERILHATEAAWESHQLAAAARARAFEIEHHKTKAELEAMTAEEYLRDRYYDPEDKQGKHHWRNLVGSEMNSAKSKSGSSFEEAVMMLADENDVAITGQVHIDETGKICSKKSRHRIDGYISAADAPPATLRDCYVVSKKTTLKERWNQDIWCIPHCKKLVFITREIPNADTIASIGHHGAVIVYPHAPITAHAWSYAEFLRRMKDFQQGATDGSR